MNYLHNYIVTFIKISGPIHCIVDRGQNTYNVSCIFFKQVWSTTDFWIKQEPNPTKFECWKTFPIMFLGKQELHPKELKCPKQTELQRSVQTLLTRGLSKKCERFHGKSKVKNKFTIRKYTRSYVFIRYICIREETILLRKILHISLNFSNNLIYSCLETFRELSLQCRKETRTKTLKYPFLLPFDFVNFVFERPQGIHKL